jgi:hypothetical protein
MRMMNPANNGNGMGDWAPARFPVPQNPITDAVSTFLSGLGSLARGVSGGGGHGSGLGAFSSVYDVTGYPILGPYDRISAALTRAADDEAELKKAYFTENEEGLYRAAASSMSGLGDFIPASFPVPQNPVAVISGLAAATTPAVSPGLGGLGAIHYGGLSGCGGRGPCGCGGACGGGDGMGNLADYLPDGMPEFLQGTVMGLPAWAVYGGGALVAYALLSRGSGYREEKRAAGEAYRRRVRRARSTYGRGYERARDAYREARSAA